MKLGIRKAGILLIAVVFFFSAYKLLVQLNEQRDEFNLTATTPLENAPPELVLATTALGGFRGIIVDYLWIRAMELQRSGKYFELVQIYDWIGKMEPRIEAIWSHNAWNMAYNISVELPSAEERWLWIKRGIELLRDEGLKYNPESSLLYMELAWIYQHKIGGFSDMFHWGYKKYLADEMERLLGKDCSELAEIASRNNSLRYKELVEILKLEPERMLKLQDLYGPLDWRLAQAHAIYWLTKGTEVRGESHTINTDRLILHAIISLCESGKIVKTDAGFLLGEPDFRFLDTADRLYRELQEKYGREVGLASSHENFLQSVVVLLYTYGRGRDSLHYYRKLVKLYPSKYRAALEDYIFARIKENMISESPHKVYGFISGILRQALVSLAIGDDEKSAGLENFAKLVWIKYMDESGGVERMALPPFEEIRDSVVKRVLESEFPEVLRERLKERLGHGR